MTYEVTDGFVRPSYEKASPKLISEKFAEGVHALGWLIHHGDRDEMRPQDYRLASWVEKSDSKFGYWLGISRTEVIQETLDDFTVQATYYKVDREHRTIVEEYPKNFSTNSLSSVEEDGKKALDIYETEDLPYAVSMLGKMAIAFKHLNYDNAIDKHVGMGIQLAHIDDLAKLYPVPGSELSTQPQGVA